MGTNPYLQELLDRLGDPVSALIGRAAELAEGLAWQLAEMDAEPEKASDAGIGVAAEAAERLSEVIEDLRRELAAT